MSSALIIGFCPMPHFLIAKPFRVPSNGMAPAIRGDLYKYDPTLKTRKKLSAGDRICVSMIAFLFGNIERGDIVAFRTEGISDPQGQPLKGDMWIRRVVGLPGE